MPSTLSPEQIQNFLHSVTKGRPDETEILLMTTPEMTQELLRSAGTFTDDAGRTFHCTAYEYAHWAKDVKMCLMLERHMDDETSFQIYSWVTVNNKKEGLVYTQKDKAGHIQSTGFDSKSLISALDTLGEKNDNIEGCKVALNKLQQELLDRQRDTKQAQIDIEQARNRVETVQRDAAIARNHIETVQFDATMAQDDVEKALQIANEKQKQTEQVLHNLNKAMGKEEQALRDEKQAANNVKRAELEVEKAPYNAEQAQLDVEKAWQDAPTYIPRMYRQSELRNINEKNTKRLNELHDTLNKEDRLFVDSILQTVPEYSPLYNAINNLKQKTISLPSELREFVYGELGFLMRNINNPAMDSSDLVRKFKDNCFSEFDTRKSFNKKWRYLLDGDIVAGGTVIGFTISLFIGAPASIIVFLALIYACSLVVIPPLALLIAFASLPVTALLFMGIGAGVGAGLAALPDFLERGIPMLAAFPFNFFKDASIKNAIQDIAESASNPVIEVSIHEESMNLITSDTSPTQDRDLAEEYRSAAPLGLFSGQNPFSSGSNDAVTYSFEPGHEAPHNGPPF